MKNAIAALLILSFSSATMAETEIATCGRYTLVQYTDGNWFAGIQHTANAYSIDDKDGVVARMRILPNSEGATFEGTKVTYTEDDSEDGVASTATVFKIVAMWDQFYLTVTPEGDGSPSEKLDCKRIPSK